MPFFSVIIPTYNRAHIIKRAIQSVLVQTFTDFEIIVVDDGSTDDTEKRVHEFRDTRIKYLFQPNAGVCSARNYGITASQSKFLCFLDSDDSVLSDWLDSFHDAITSGDYDLVFCDMRICYSDASQKSIRALYPYRNNAYDDHGLFLAGTFAIRKTVIDVIGGFDENIHFGEFTELGFRCRKLQLSRYFTQKEGLIYYKSTDGGAGDQQNRIHSHLYLLNKHAWYFKEYPHALRLYLQNIAVGSARLGKWNIARKFFLRAYWVEPWKLKTLVRFCIACIPILAHRIWVRHRTLKKAALPLVIRSL